MNYNNYDWIDYNVAVGDNKSNYSDFDIIVNLDFPNNGVEYHSIDLECINGKHIYRLGCYDSEEEDMEYFLREMMPELYKYYIRNPNIKILFHCYAGISRSSTMAIAFLSIIRKYSLEQSYINVLSRRSIIRPNNGFIKCLIKHF
jgi:protein-tyrosine phosphatase